jgi:hypothetical protein
MRTKAVAVLLGGLLGTGCLVQVETTSDPEGFFQKGREEATHLQGVPGRAHEARILVYDSRKKELLQVCVPLWLAHEMADDESHGESSLHLKGKVDLAALEKAGRGASVEVNDEGGRVLVWLR